MLPTKQLNFVHMFYSTHSKLFIRKTSVLIRHGSRSDTAWAIEGLIELQRPVYKPLELTASYIHSFNHSFIQNFYILLASFQGNYSEALPTPVRTKKAGFKWP